MPETEAEWDKWLAGYVKRFPSHLRDDLMQEARLALWNARRRYKPGSGASFPTFAYAFVKGNISHYLRDRATMIRVAAWAHDAGVRVFCTSNAAIQGGEERDVYETTVAPNAKPLETEVVLSVQVDNALSHLTERERAIVVMRDMEGRTFTEIGQTLGWSTSYITYLHRAAKERLRNLLAGATE